MDTNTQEAEMIEPLADRIVVRPIERAATSPGGLHIPDVAKDRPQRGEVVAVGRGKAREDGGFVPPEVHVGDTVVYGKFSGTEVDVDSEALLVLKEGDVLAVVARKGA